MAKDMQTKHKEDYRRLLTTRPMFRPTSTHGNQCQEYGCNIDSFAMHLALSTVIG